MCSCITTRVGLHLMNSRSAWDLSVRQSLTTLFRVHHGSTVRDENNIGKPFNFAMDASFDIKEVPSVVVNNNRK
jgi:hypothetical protein